MSKLDLDKLAKICAMFRSDFPEERATAAAIADAMVRESGHSWEILFKALGEASERIADLESRLSTVPVWSPAEWVEPDSIQAAIENCLDWPSALSEWELHFLVSISGRQRLSQKQINVLRRCITKARAAARATAAKASNR